MNMTTSDPPVEDTASTGGEDADNPLPAADGKSWFDRHKAVFDVAQATAATLALAAGALWFALQGSWRASRLTIEQKITHVRIDDNYNLLLVKIKLNNDGAVAIEVPRMLGRLLVLEPSERVVLDALEQGYEPPRSGSAGTWPAIERDEPRRRLIEAGGQDAVEFSYFVPAVVRAVRSEAYIGKRGNHAWFDVEYYSFVQALPGSATGDSNAK